MKIRLKFVRFNPTVIKYVHNIVNNFPIIQNQKCTYMPILTRQAFSFHGRVFIGIVNNLINYAKPLMFTNGQQNACQ